MTELETDILRILRKEGPLFPCTLRERLRQVYQSYKGSYRDDRSFDVVISRKLKKLVDEGKLDKEDKGHQRVHYSIKEQARANVNKALFEYDIGKAISRGELYEVEISKQRIDKIVDEVLDEVVDTIWFMPDPYDEQTKQKMIEETARKMKAGLRKDVGKEAQKAVDAIAPAFLWFKEREQIRENCEGIKALSEFLKIRVISEPGESTPILTDTELERLFQVLLLNMMDQNTHQVRKSFHIFASFEISKELLDSIQKMSMNMNKPNESSSY